MTSPSSGLPGCSWTYLRFMKVARASRSGFENKPDRDGLATVWTPAAFDGLAHIRRYVTDRMSQNSLVRFALNNRYMKEQGVPELREI